MASKRPNGCKRQDGAFLPPLKRQKLAGKRDDEELKEETDHEYMARDMRRRRAMGGGSQTPSPTPQAALGADAHNGKYIESTPATMRDHRVMV